MKEYTIHYSKNLFEAISAIKNNDSRSIILINENKKVYSVLTEGDILKALVGNISLYTPILKIKSSEFVYSEKRNILDNIKFFEKGHSLLPILNKEFILIDVQTSRQLIKKLSNTVET